MNTTEKIFALMSAKNITAYQLSKELGITESLFSHWKSGLQKPKSEAIVKLARYFNVTTDYLLGLTDDPQQASTNVAKEPKKLAEILNDYMAANNLQISEDELSVALAAFLAAIEGFKKDKE